MFLYNRAQRYPIVAVTEMQMMSLRIGEMIFDSRSMVFSLLAIQPDDKNLRAHFVIKVAVTRMLVKRDQPIHEFVVLIAAHHFDFGRFVFHLCTFCLHLAHLDKSGNTMIAGGRGCIGIRVSVCMGHSISWKSRALLA
jgi:hypothetical protein